MKENTKIFGCSLIAALSSFLFGTFLTSDIVLYKELEASYKTYNLFFSFDFYKSVFASTVFLGAFLSSCLGFYLNGIDKKIILLVNNITYLIGSILILLYDDIFISLLSRLIIGVGAGISCCIVPNYIFQITDDKNRGFYMSFHSVGIVLGLVVGKILGVFFLGTKWNLAYLIILFLVIAHTALLCIVRKCPFLGDGDFQTSIYKLLKHKPARKSLFLATCFHISQHACGIEYFTFFSEKLLVNDPNANIQGIYHLAFSALISVLNCIFIDQLGRKFFICLSSILVIFCTFCMGLKDDSTLLIYLYMFSYNIGLSSIPWFITNEIFTVEYVAAATRLTIAINWLSAFIFSSINMSLHTFLENWLFWGYSLLMSMFLFIVLKYFRETKNRPVGFQ